MDLSAFKPQLVELHWRGRADAEVDFLRAVGRGSIEDIKVALDKGANPLAYTQRENEAKDALLTSLRMDAKPEVIDFLIDLGLDRVDRSHLPQTFMPSLGARGYSDLLEKLITRGTDVNFVCEFGTTALMRAAFAHRTETMQRLLDLGANVLHPSGSGDTALHLASREDVIDILLSTGMNIDAPGLGGRSPLAKAIEHGSLDLAKILISKGASLDWRDDRQNTLLHFAANCSSPETAIFLLELGADPEAKDSDGKTPQASSRTRIVRAAIGAWRARRAMTALARPDGQLRGAPPIVG